MASIVGIDSRAEKYSSVSTISLLSSSMGDSLSSSVLSIIAGKTHDDTVDF